MWLLFLRRHIIVERKTFNKTRLCATVHDVVTDHLTVVGDAGRNA